MQEIQRRIRRYNVAALGLALIWLGGLGSLASLFFSRKSLKLLAQNKSHGLYGKPTARIAMGLACIGLAIWMPIILIGLYNHL